jgi:hypothetical protein
MSRWFRFYDCVLDDPKVQRLPLAEFKTWVNLLCVASRHNGYLPPLDDLAFSLRMDPQELARQLDYLTAADLIDVAEDGTYGPHNWDARQFKSDDSAERVRKHRAKRSCNGDVTADVTAPDTDTDTDTEQKEEKGAEAPPDPSVEERAYFERGREVLGKREGATLNNLLKAKGGNVALARSVIEAASTKDAPKEWVYGAIRQRAPPKSDKQSAQDVARALQEWTNAHDPGPSNVYPLLPSASSEPDPHPDRLLSQRRV